MPALAYLLSCLLVVGAGVSVAVQQVINANLRGALGSPWWASLSNFAVGLVAVLMVALLAPGPKPTPAAIAAAPWYAWTGGLLGAIFISVGILMIPRLGAATVIAFIVVGQLTASLLLDHFGLFGLPQHTASPVRLIGAALLLSGAVLVRL